MTTRLEQLAKTALLTALLAAPASAQTPEAKLDESLRESIERGCAGVQPVIIRTKPGYRQALRDSLASHGDTVKGEFPALDAIAADVHCDDLTALAGFASTDSVSFNGPVAVQSLGLTSLTSDIQSARSVLLAAKESAQSAQRTLRAAEKTSVAAKAQLAAAERALVLARRATYGRAAAVAAAEVKLAAARAASSVANQALEVARTAATKAQAAVVSAQNKLVDAQQALLEVKTAGVSREREARAAKDLKRKFFGTMAVRSSQTMTDDQFDNEDDDYSRYETAASRTGGAGIGIAVIDSGIQSGTDFDDRITAFYDFTNGDIRVTAPVDPYGHGTHVAGLVASEFVGVAPNARLIGLRVLDHQGRGVTANVVRAVEFAIANKDLLGINVLNLSLGHPIYEPAATDPLVQAVEHAVRKGIVVVASAGNFGINRQTGQPGYAGIVSPGNAPSAVTVGAVRTFNTVTRLDDRVAPYSSRGPSWYDGFAKPDVVAPGDNLLSVAAGNSSLRSAQEVRGNTGNYMRLSGTSMAAGVTTGVVALVLQANPHLTPNAVKAVLEFSSIPVLDDLGERFDALSQGTGQIQVAGAVALARVINTDAPLGSPWLSSSVTPSTVIGSQSYAWSQSMIWGNRRVAGKNLLAEQRPAWGLGIVWGEGLGSEDDNIVWGNLFGDDDNIVWGNSFDDDDNIVWGNNIVWGSDDDNIVWGNLFGDDDNIVWGNLFGDDDNIVWGNLFGDDDNIVWGNSVVWGNGLIGLLFGDDDNIVWGNLFGDDDNIVWGNLDDDNIVWGNLYDDNVVWGNMFGDDDNIVWGNSLDDDNIVWGNEAQLGSVFRWSGGVVSGKATNARARRTFGHRREGVR